MKIKILSVGTKAPQWIRAGFEEYAKRMPREMPLALVEIAPPKHGAEADKFIQIEDAKMMSQLESDDWVVALDERGKQVTSTQLAGKLDRWRMQGGNVVFVIGGSDGLGESVLARSNEQIALLALTFPHYMVRVILAEMIYRAWTIVIGHPYHRA